MARKRMIDPGIWQSESFGALSHLGKVLWIGLFSNADDEGRIKASAAYLKATILPYGNDPLKTIESAFQDIITRDMVRPYEVNGIRYAYIPKWCEYQKIDRKFDSKLPPPNQRQDNDKTTTRQRQDNDKTTHEEKRSEKKYPPVQQHRGGVVVPAHTRAREEPPQEAPKSVVVFEGEKDNGKAKTETEETPPQTHTHSPLDPEIYSTAIRALQAVLCRTDAPTGQEIETYAHIIQRKGPTWAIETTIQNKDLILARTANRPPWPFLRGVLQNRLKDPHDGKPMADVMAELEKQKFLASGKKEVPIDT